MSGDQPPFAESAGRALCDLLTPMQEGGVGGVGEGGRNSTEESHPSLVFPFLQTWFYYFFTLTVSLFNKSNI